MKYLKIILASIVITFSLLATNVRADEIITPDTTIPVITLLGDSNIDIHIGENYVDSGATAMDDVDGDITANIIISGSVDTGTLGTYTISYDVADIGGNNAVEVTRTVNVIENIVIPVPDVNFTLRDGADIVWQGSVPLPALGDTSLNDVNSNPHTVSSDSLLAVLSNADLITTNFNITDLEYYDSFGSFYLRCIASNLGGEKCDNWQYTVNGSYPGIGLDKIILTGGENIYLYFGSQYKIELDKNSISEKDTVTVSTKEYDYENNSWKIRSGVTVGLTQPDPSNPWSPTEVLTSVVDENGNASFKDITAGKYNVGVQEDYYFPTETLDVYVPASSGGGGSADSSTSFSVENAISYLNGVQAPDGSFGGSPMYTDWAAIAYASSGTQNSKMLSYLENHNTISGHLTDNERRAMALLAVGENPYDFHGVNYINAILKTWDGAQFGDANLVNDDIFALLPLYASGYTKNDTEIKDAIKFIIAHQNSNGSWEDSVDVTAASVQALTLYKSVSGVSGALSNAGSYLASMQEDNGGLGNAPATSWAMQAESALNKSWLKNGNSGKDYLSSMQEKDGGVLKLTESLENRIWATSYAVPGVLGLAWGDILQGVSKPETENNSPEDKVDPEVVPEVIDTIPTTPIVLKAPTQENINKIIKKINNVKVETKNKTPEINPEINTSPLGASAASASPSLFSALIHWLVSVFTKFISIF